jgi:adenine-specific DNA-methyltransferase
MPSLDWIGKKAVLNHHREVPYHLLKCGKQLSVGDRSPAGGNVLTNAILKALPAHDGPRIVYGEGCRLGKARLKREGILFKQIPYGVKVA